MWGVGGGWRQQEQEQEKKKEQQGGMQRGQAGSSYCTHFGEQSKMASAFSFLWLRGTFIRFFGGIAVSQTRSRYGPYLYSIKVLGLRTLEFLPTRVWAKAAQTLVGNKSRVLSPRTLIEHK